MLFGKEGLNNLVHDYLIAAMQVGNFMNYLEQDLLIVTPPGTVPTSSSPA